MTLRVAICCIIGFLSLSNTLQAAVPRWMCRIVDWVDRSDTVNTDSTYVRLTKEGFIAYVNLLNTGTVGNLTFKKPGLPAGSNRLSTATSDAIGLSVAYRGWGLSYARHRDSEWNDDDYSFSFNSRRYFLDYRYHSARSLRADDLSNLPVEEGQGRMRTTSFTAYWVFQREHFSHPGATLHTTYQLRSAGSWLAAVNYWHGRYFDGSGRLSDDFRRLSLSHLNLGGGYAYTWVFAHQHCTLTGIVTPMLNIWHRNRLYTQQGSMTVLEQGLSADAIGRLCFAYTHGRYLAGFQLYGDYGFTPCKGHFDLHTLDWSSRCFVGVRF